MHVSWHVSWGSKDEPSDLVVMKTALFMEPWSGRTMRPWNGPGLCLDGCGLGKWVLVRLIFARFKCVDLSQPYSGNAEAPETANVLRLKARTKEATQLARLQRQTWTFCFSTPSGLWNCIPLYVASFMYFCYPTIVIFRSPMALSDLLWRYRVSGFHIIHIFFPVLVVHVCLFRLQWVCRL